jgi:DNA-binding GntR family transcriptional regulator
MFMLIEALEPQPEVPFDQRESAREGNETIASQIRTSLADAITSGRMAPGTEIDEQEVAQRFGASRTPVREALRELASSGLVIIEPRRGVRVVEMTLDRIGEMFEVAAEIESVCARFATYRMTALERFELQRLHNQSYEPAIAGDVDRYDAINRLFHAKIYKVTHSAFLCEHAAGLRMRLAPFRRAQFRGERRLKLSYDEHAAILDSIFAGDGEAAAKLMRAHILIASAVYAAYAQGNQHLVPGQS